MPSTRRPRSVTPLVSVLLALALTPGVACRRASPAGSLGSESSVGGEHEVTSSACEGQPLVADLPFELPEAEDPLRCTELTLADPVPLPTQASCAALPREERAACVAEVRGRARAERLLAEAQAAATASDWPLAITKLEAAVDLSSAADLLAALGWGRYRANRWCDETQDRADLEATLDNAEEGASEAPVADLCVRRASLHQAAEELGTAIDGAPSREHLATWELHRAEVALALGATDDALRSARVAVCAHDDRAGRELLGTLLFRLGHRVGTSDAREALRLYLASLAVAPNPERRAYVDEVVAALRGGFALEAEAPASPARLLPTVDALCTELVLANMNEPVEPAELPEGLCEVGEWDEVGLMRGDDLDVHFHVTTLTVQDPELSDGPMSTTYLVARTARGVNVLLELGRDHGDSRQHNAFVTDIGTSYHFDNPDAPLVVTWSVGEAEAYDCTWQSRASRQLAVCALLDGTPGCFAKAELGPTEYTSDSMLPTIQESLGNCTDEDYAEPMPPLPSEFRPRYDVDVTSQELVAVRAEDGARRCLPLRETLSPLRPSAAAR